MALLKPVDYRSGPARLSQEGLQDANTGKENKMKYLIAVSNAAITLCALILMAAPAQATTTPITFSYTGTQSGPETLDGSILTASHLLNGSIFSSDPAWNAALNPFTGIDHDLIDLDNGILDGSVTFTFANGDTLFGTQHVIDLFEDAETQFLMFTGGTGEFLGATGSALGTASLTSDGYMTSGSGSIDIPAPVPEPASASLFLTGLAVVSIERRWALLKRAATRHRRPV